MKRTSVIACIALVAASLIATSALAQKNASGRSKKTQKIQVREVAVKSQPSYMSQTVGTLSFGATVEVNGTEGNWYRIEHPAGYIPQNVVGSSSASVDSSKRYAASSVTHDETALAGKGFNPQVEGQYKKSSASLTAAYTQVDRVERMSVSDAALNQFITSGQLKK